MANRKGFLDEAVVLARFGTISLRSFGLFASGLADRKQFEKHETARKTELRSTRGKRIMSDHIIHDHNDAGIDRQAFLKSMAGAGTGAFCVLKGGVLKAFSPETIRHDARSEGRAELCPAQRQPCRFQPTDKSGCHRLLAQLAHARTNNPRSSDAGDCQTRRASRDR